MLYIFDTSTLSTVFNFYYRDSFPSFWSLFDEMILNKNILSVREVRNEIKNYKYKNELEVWAKANASFFSDPTQEELEFVTKIYSVPHFLNNISKKQQIKAEPIADPFVIAKAYIENGTVITEEKNELNAARIPNICAHFNIPCTNLQGFLKQENWSF